jgi:hypothetical protein
MSARQAVVAGKGLVVAQRVETAEDAASRSRGLLGRPFLPQGDALWIVPCPMIHTFFMQFSIDVLFLDASAKVVRVIENLKPWRLSPWVLSAHSVLELPAGTLKGQVAVGDRLEFKNA